VGIDTFAWPLVDEFVDREDQLRRMEGWWADPSRVPLALVGRRRVGKSWLLRRFAHDKHALILVSEQLPAGAQLTRFSEQLEPVLGVRPDLPDLAALFRVIYRAGRKRKLLVVVDEFPYLLGTSAPAQRRALSTIQSVMEDERDSSKVKLIVCGSQVAQMESLFSERSPLYGRFDRFDVRPLRFADAVRFFGQLGAIDAFERYAVAGGMPMYLSRLSHGTLRAAVCASVLHPDAPLWNEGRGLVEQELREPRTYFGILVQLSSGPKQLHEIAQPIGVEATSVSRYLHTLQDLRLVSRSAPHGAKATSKSGHWQLDDPFLRFWFRFVFPYQSDLEQGLAPEALYDADVKPHLSEHVSPVFETWCLEWLRRHRAADATIFGRWWGNSANIFRRTGERTTEEVDAVGGRRGGVVTLVSEAKWSTRKLGPGIVGDLRTYKIPAMCDGGLKVADSPAIVLFSKSGYTSGLRQLAADDPAIELVDVADALGTRE